MSVGSKQHGLKVHGRNWGMPLPNIRTVPTDKKKDSINVIGAVFDLLCVLPSIVNMVGAVSERLGYRIFSV